MVGDDSPRGVPRTVVSGLFRLRVGLVQEPLLLESFAAIGVRDVAVNLAHVGSCWFCWLMLVLLVHVGSWKGSEGRQRQPVHLGSLCVGVDLRDACKGLYGGVVQRQRSSAWRRKEVTG